jgi:hypothetical protein
VGSTGCGGSDPGAKFPEVAVPGLWFLAAPDIERGTNFGGTSGLRHLTHCEHDGDKEVYRLTQ